jgi:hypothetical protein
VNLTIAVQIVPYEGNRPVLEQAFGAVTKEFSSTGVSLVVNEPFSCEHAIVGLKWDGELFLIKGEFRHQDPLGAGFWVVGLRLLEVVDVHRWPELQELTI